MVTASELVCSQFLACRMCGLCDVCSWQGFTLVLLQWGRKWKPFVFQKGLQGSCRVLSVLNWSCQRTWWCL